MQVEYKNTLRKRIALLILVSAMITMVLACNNQPGGSVTEDKLVIEFEVWTKTGIVRIDFVTSELTYFEMESSDDGTTIQLNPEDLSEYRGYVAEYTEQINSTEGSQKASDGSQGSQSDSESIAWKIVAIFDNDEVVRLYGVRDCPDGWDILVNKTNELVGFDFLQ